MTRVNHGLGNLGRRFIVLGQPPPAAEPAEGPFHHPPARLHPLRAVAVPNQALAPVRTPHLPHGGRERLGFRFDSLCQQPFTRLDTPLFSNRRHPGSGIAQSPGDNGAPAGNHEPCPGP